MSEPIKGFVLKGETTMNYTQSAKAAKLRADIHKIITNCCKLLEIERNKREKRESKVSERNKKDIETNTELRKMGFL